MLKRLGQISRNNQGGFTLVELMIVVAIIGILAAIAIPQFAAYRIRGFNASANSDVKNIATAESALFADTQRYGVTFEIAAPFAAPAALPGPAAGVVVIGGNATIDGLVTTNAGGVGVPIQIGVGNGVRVIALSNAAVAGPPAINAWFTFTAVGKHDNGDLGFGVDGDTTNVYQNPTAATYGPGIVLAAGLASTTADDFTTAAAVAAGWVVR